MFLFHFIPKKLNKMKKLTVCFIAVFALAFSTSTLSAQCHSRSSRSSQKVHKAVYVEPTGRTDRANSQRRSGEKDLVQLAASSHNLSTLVAAVKAAGLVETLQGKGPFTIFAPTNNAFAALPDGTVENLLKPENKADLVKILTYHVVPGRIEANDLSSGKVASVEGSNIEVTVGESAIQINDAIVIDANNRAVNGVVHVIDRVILPE